MKNRFSMIWCWNFRCCLCQFKCTFWSLLFLLLFGLM